jgi:cation diffusion facilitator CzcD-associated flavoprotein CzcO
VLRQTSAPGNCFDESLASEAHHTGLWPQGGIDLSGKRVGVIGSGASGVQVVQEAAGTAAQVTQFIRTPNLALPMNQRPLTGADQARIKSSLPERFAVRSVAFSGFDIDFDPRTTFEVSDEERQVAYEERWRKGGFHFWLGAFQDLLFDEDANNAAYAFWRDKTRARINDPETADILAPIAPIHPFGVKRPSLEQNYFDAFNQDNVSVVNLRANPIRSITPTGVRTVDGVEHGLDVLVYATGFDANTGGLTQIKISGTDDALLSDKWATGVDAYLGMATHGFPNMLFVYGPQSPSGFCNGPTCAEIQGDMIVDLIEYLRNGRYSRIEATRDADEAWTAHVEEAYAPSPFDRADSWYLAANVPGKKRQMLQYPAGLSTYRAKFDESLKNGLAGFQVA